MDVFESAVTVLAPAEVLLARHPAVDELVRASSIATFVWFLLPQHVALEEAWCAEGWSGLDPPSSWVESASSGFAPPVPEHPLRTASEALGLDVQLVGLGSSSLDDAIRSFSEDWLHPGGRIQGDAQPPPALDVVRLLRGARDAGWSPRSAAIEYARTLDLPVSADVEAGRAVLQAWCHDRFEADNTRALESLGLSASVLVPPSPAEGDIELLDRLWVAATDATETALFRALVEREENQGASTEVAAVSQQLARARAEVIRARGELERVRSRRSVRAALRLASVASPFFRLARDGSGGRSKGSPTAKQPRVIDRGPIERRADLIVCVHNALEDVRRCLDSIVSHTDLARHQLILVDDGSGPETAAYLQTFAEQRSVSVIRHAEARGYTVAAAAGIAAGDAPFAVLLNSDTIVTPRWLDGLLDVVLEDRLTAVVGPWSNAASWQSVPELTDEAGGWHLNPLPEGQTPDDIAAAVVIAQPLRPEIPLVNGFCYLLRRSAYDAVGGLDTENFHRGYGEEDDLSLRLTAAGYRLRVADDVYVHHAKSRSFTPEGRARIVDTSKETLRGKHGADRVREVVTSVQHAEGLVRARTWAALRIDTSRRTARDHPRLTGQPRIAWVQPHLEEVGGIRRAITMTNLMRAWGAEPALVTPDGEPTNWLPIRAEVLSIDEAARRTFDVVVLSDPDMVTQSLRLEAGRRVIYHLAAYMKYRPLDDRLRAYYDVEGLHLANSRWTADAVEEFTGVHVAGIVPGAVDPATFHPVRTRITHDVVCYGSARAHKGTATIVEAARGLELLKLVDLYLPQSGLATGICSGRVFASGAWHEGFNLPPLEAMACGVPVVMTDDGGSRDYARDGQNALVVPVGDARAMRQALRRLLEDEPLRARLIEQGLRTAAQYTWESATTRFLEAVLGAKV